MLNFSGNTNSNHVHLEKEARRGPSHAIGGTLRACHMLSNSKKIFPTCPIYFRGGRRQIGDLCNSLNLYATPVAYKCGRQAFRLLTFSMFYLLFAQLRFENVGGVSDGSHAVHARLHARQPRLDFLFFGVIALAVHQQRVQLRLPLHHFGVGLLPVLPQLSHCNNGKYTRLDLCSSMAKS
jgi:hypothetical protein